MLDLTQNIGFAIVVVNLILCAFVMRRAPWFRPIGWVGLNWMFWVFVFYIAVFLGKASASDLNQISSGLRILGLGSFTVALIYLTIEVIKEARRK